MKKAFYITVCFLALLHTASATKQIKVACVGNSITYGIGVANREQEAYPMQLQAMLGKDYIVGNFGKPGATLLNKGHRPYTRQEEFSKALAFAGDIVVIHLGINDTDPRNWPNYRDEFIADYLALIDSFKAVNPKSRIIIARMTPIFNNHPRFESGTRDWHEQIQTSIDNVAKYADVQLVDLHEPLYPHPNLLPDAVHPNKQGAFIMAKSVYSAITGDYGGLSMPIPYTDNMVLQRDRALSVNGVADALEKVTVEIGKEKHSVIATDNGKWEITLPPLTAGGPYILKISTHNKTLTYRNVLIGEVWLCSGQSNMEFMLKSAATASIDIPKCVNPNIRLFDMKGLWSTGPTEWQTTSLDSVNNLKFFADAIWQECTPASAANFSAVAYYFGQMLQDSLKCPVGLICNAVGGSSAESWVSRNTLELSFPAILRDWKENDFIQDWVRGRAATNIKKSTDKLQRHPYEPCYLYEAGIVPLHGYQIRGVIWYQGESNANNCDTHEKVFSLMVDSWRKNWLNDGLPFYYAQLSSLNRPSWTWFRDSQRLLAKKIPNIYMTVTSDHGDSLNVHPINKKPVGERLALQALYYTYNMKDHTPCGPVLRDVEFTDEAAYLHFDFADGMKSSDGKPLRTFEIAQTDGIYYPAVAVIEEGQVKVYNKRVEHPRYIRYGWQPFTRANLVNSAGLPASTFRVGK
ncbi:MAG: GDSL-type esterase/lipase family protein [Bacteroidales bacterium]